jgi:glycosyltransferase involved in cell wall biosynthesis
VIAISNPVRHWALNSLNVNNGKLGVIEYGINAERWPEHQRMATSSSGAVIGSMGRLEQRKGHQFLIQAMPQILRYDAGAKLIIAGHDTWGYGEALRLEARRVGVLDHVQFAGYQEARTFFPQLDVFAFASLSEGFGQVLIEAMACSIPCVATDAPPLSTILQNGLSGLLARPADPKSFAEAIVRLLADRPLRGALGAAARQRVMENYSAARMTAETFGLYQTLLQ